MASIVIFILQVMDCNCCQRQMHEVTSRACCVGFIHCSHKNIFQHYTNWHGRHLPHFTEQPKHLLTKFVLICISSPSSNCETISSRKSMLQSDDYIICPQTPHPPTLITSDALQLFPQQYILSLLHVSLSSQLSSSSFPIWSGCWICFSFPFPPSA